MIEIPAFAVLLAVEAIAAMTAMLAYIAFRKLRRRNEDERKTVRLVERLSHGGGSRSPTARLSDALAASSLDLPVEIRTQAIEAAEMGERALYRHVVGTFLTQDANLLEQVDGQVQILTEPYCRVAEALLQRLEESEAAAAQAKPLQEHLQRIETLLSENARLKARVEELEAGHLHLRAEMRELVATLDEVSEEYARIFHEHRDSAALQASRIRMLQRFRQASGLPDMMEGDARQDDSP